MPGLASGFPSLYPKERVAYDGVARSTIAPVAPDVLRAASKILGESYATIACGWPPNA